MPTLPHTRWSLPLLSALLLGGCQTAGPDALISLGILAPQPATQVAPQPTATPADKSPDKSAAREPAKSFLSPEASQHCIDTFIEPYKASGAVVPVTTASNDFERIVVKQVIAHSSPEILASSKADAAAKERDTLWEFSSALGPKFTAANCTAINAFIDVAFTDAKRINTAIKKQFNRPRPSEGDPDNPKKNPSFPSGHSTTAGLRYRLLAAITDAPPQVEVELFKQAWYMCYQRLAVNVHYPSDVAAGLVLGEMIADEVLKAAAADPSSPAAKALQAAKAEWQSLK